MPQKLSVLTLTMLATVSFSMTAAGQSTTNPAVDPVILIASDIAADSPYPEITDLPRPEVFAPAANLRPITDSAPNDIGHKGVIVARPSAATMLPPTHDTARQPLMSSDQYAASQSACLAPSQVQYPITPIQPGERLSPADVRPSLLEPSSAQGVFPPPSATTAPYNPSYSPATSRPGTVVQGPSYSEPIYSAPLNSPSINTMPPRIVDYTVPMNPTFGAPTYNYAAPSYVTPSYIAPSSYMAPTGPVVVAYPQTGVYGTLPTTGRGTTAATARPPVSRGGVSLGSGLYGQPTAYVDGQPVRNFFRWLSP